MLSVRAVYVLGPLHVVGADFIQDVLTRLFAADFRGKVIQPAAKQTELVPRGSRDSSGANRRTPTHSSKRSVLSELRPARGERSLSCSHAKVERSERGEVSSGARSPLSVGMFGAASSIKTTSRTRLSNLQKLNSTMKP